MAIDGASFSATLKAGRDYDSSWLVVYGENAADLEQKLDALHNSQVLAKTTALNAQFQAANNLTKGGAMTGNAQSQNQNWANGQQQTQQPQQQPPQGGNRAQQHPEGKQCQNCGQVLEAKKTRNGKNTWSCPQWRWQNGQPNGHDRLWVD